MKCVVCKKDIPKNRLSLLPNVQYCSRLCRNKAYNKQFSRVHAERSRKRRKELIQLVGGRCIDCGLQKDSSYAYDFHHRNPEEKSFTLSGGSITKKSMQELRTEALKCDLLCAICHRKRHTNE